MEFNEQNQEHNIHEFFKKLLFERDERIRSLESKINEQPEGDNVWEDRYKALQTDVAAKFVKADEKIAALEAELKVKETSTPSFPDSNKTENKAGNLLWTLAFVFLGFVAGYFIKKWFFTPKDSNAVAFQKMKDDHQFNFEFELSKGRFDKVESNLLSLKKDQYPQLKTEIDFTRKLLAAAHRKFAEAGFQPDETGVSLPAPSNEPVIVEATNRKTLTVTEDKLSVRQEASSKTKRLAKLKRGQQVYVIDRTTKRDKIAYVVEGRLSTIRDYWYKIEMEDGTEGWVFGYFTTRSINSVQFDEPAPTPDPEPLTPEAVRVSLKDTTKAQTN